MRLVPLVTQMDVGEGPDAPLQDKMTSKECRYFPLARVLDREETFSLTRILLIGGFVSCVVGLKVID